MAGTPRDWWAEEWGDDSGFGDESEGEEWEGEGWERGEGESRGEFESDGVGESEKEGQQDVRRGGGRSSSGWRRRELVEGWVEGPDESADLAFSWVNEAGRQEDLISPAAKRYQWVLDRLCDAFECATDQLTVTSLTLPLPLLEADDLVLHGLFDTSPVLTVFTGSFFDKFWRGDKRVYRCVLAAFRCATIWCVHAQTLALLLPNGPSARLERELDKGLWSIRPLPLVQQPEGGEGAGVGVGGGRVGMGMGEEEEEEHWEMEKVPPGQVVRMQFDMALHVRGRPSKVELGCANGDLSCLQLQQQQQREQQEREQQELVASLLRPSRWHCIVRLAQFLRMKKAAALLSSAASVDAAADSAGGGDATASASAAAEEAGGTAAAAAAAAAAGAGTSASPPDPSNASSRGTDEVRPAMVKFLRPFGRVFFSNAPAIHLSKSLSQGSHLSTLGDFLMLSKPSVVVSFTRYISTFAMFAAMLGNGTLVAQPESESNCRFVVEHLAQMPPDLT
ncbi:unnamed protein product [Closterium sp. NIES-64]|nr:unnamed protein product [Closterium sp. NIES-64]